MTRRVGNTSSLRWKNLWTIGAIVLMTWALALWGAAATPADEVTKTFPVTGHARVHVETDDGAVRVSTGDIKQIEVRVDYSGYKLDKDLRVSTSQNGDSVDVSVKTGGSLWRWGVRHTSLRVEIHMPKEADLTIRTGDGSVEADSISGNVDVTSGDGSVNARATAGSKVQSTWTIHTGDGSVDIEIPGDLQADIDASTHDGHISLGLPVTVEGTFSSSQIRGKMNGGGQSLTIRTGDGSIHLSKS